MPTVSHSVLSENQLVTFRTKRCSRGGRCDPGSCVFSHRQQGGVRRSPFVRGSTEVLAYCHLPCPQGHMCVRGRACPMAHTEGQHETGRGEGRKDTEGGTCAYCMCVLSVCGVCAEEIYFHPLTYKTRVCPSRSCSRKHCPFIHGFAEERRGQNLHTQTYPNTMIQTRDLRSPTLCVVWCVC